MVKKKTRRKSRRRKSTKRVARGWRWGRLLLSLGLLVALLVGGYAVYLGKTVRVKFEGKRWAEPAQI